MSTTAAQTRVRNECHPGLLSLPQEILAMICKVVSASIPTKSLNFLPPCGLSISESLKIFTSLIYGLAYTINRPQSTLPSVSLSLTCFPESNSVANAWQMFLK